MAKGRLPGKWDELLYRFDAIKTTRGSYAKVGKSVLNYWVKEQFPKDCIVLPLWLWCCKFSKEKQDFLHIQRDPFSMEAGGHILIPWNSNNSNP